LRTGKPVLDAAEEAVTEIGLAVIATTATIVVVFLPTAFMSGVPGIIFKQFGWTAVFAVLVSLLVARVLTPMMAAHFLKPHPVTDEDGPAMRAISRRALVPRPRLPSRHGRVLFGTCYPRCCRPGPAQDRGSAAQHRLPGSSVDTTRRPSRRRAIADVPGSQRTRTVGGQQQGRAAWCSR
jgi:multidrug efflux pump subunit AcrB